MRIKGYKPDVFFKFHRDTGRLVTTVGPAAPAHIKLEQRVPVERMMINRPDVPEVGADKIARFIVQCEAESGRRVTKRLRELSTHLFIDEFQDLAGWDLTLVEELLLCGIGVTLVGDPRQHIYSTNPSQKNKQYLGVKVAGLVDKWQADGLCQVVSMNAARLTAYRTHLPWRVDVSKPCKRSRVRWCAIAVRPRPQPPS